MATTKESGTPAGDRRVRRTQAALQHTLMRLVQEQDLSQVSVADVAERAGVSRSTFYDHYRDVHELAEAACTTMIDDLIESLSALGPDRDAAPSLRAFFACLAEHAGLYRSLLGPQGSPRVVDHVRRRIATAAYLAARATPAGTAAGTAAGTVRPPAPEAGIPHDVPAAFTAGALIGVAADWLQRGCPRTPAEMAALTWPLLADLYRVGDATPGP